MKTKNVLLTAALFAMGFLQLIAQNDNQSRVAMFDELAIQKLEAGKYMHSVYLLEAALNYADKQNEAAIKERIRISRECIKYLQKAADKVLSEKYDAAKIYYEKILEMNPKDEFCLTQIRKCNEKLSQVSTE